MKRTTPRPRPRYNCKQAELYAILEIGWNSYLSNLGPFGLYSLLYTLLYGNDSMTQLAAARALPSNQQSGEASETLNIQMGEKGALAVNK